MEVGARETLIRKAEARDVITKMDITVCGFAVNTYVAAPISM